MTKDSGKEDWTWKAVTPEELERLAFEGVFRRRRRKSKYRTFLEGFKNSSNLAVEAEKLTESQVSQLTAAIPKVFGPGNVTTKTLDVTGEGKDTRYDLLLLKVTPETQQILSSKKIYAGARSRTTVVQSGDSQ